MKPKSSPTRELPKKLRRNWFWRTLGIAFALAIWVLVGAAGVVVYLVWKTSRDLPDYESLARYEPAVMTRIYAHDGSLIMEFARERRIFVPIDAVPKLVIAAFLSAEDRRFYDHGGVDYLGIVRAVVNNLQHFGKKRLEGGSTITQQVAKNFLLTSEQSFDRKLKEAMLALRIERAYSKDKILELYLNEIFFGNNSYGVAAAALNYFNKELSELTIEEAAYLAALPKAPNNYHYLRKTKEATARRDWIIDQMTEAGYIKPEQARVAKSHPLTVNIRPGGPQVYAADYFAEDVRRTLVANFGEEGLYGRAERGAVSDGRINGGLSVRTTIDPDMQRMARKALVDGLVTFDRSRGWRGTTKTIDTAGNWGAALANVEVPGELAPWRLGVVLDAQRLKAVVGLRPERQADGALPEARDKVELPFDEVKWARTARVTPRAVTDVLKVGDVIWVAPKDPARPNSVWSLMQLPEIDGGLVVMDPHTGRVLAVVGGFSFSGKQFDRALQGKRQPGSVFKPIVYAAALENGYKPTDLVLDEPIEIDLGHGKTWTPKNYEGGSGAGPQTLRAGVEKSRNLMTVRLAQAMGFAKVGDYAKRSGLYEKALALPSLALGSGEVTLLQMCAAYASFDNGGRLVQPTLIDRIQDRWGRSLWRNDTRECKGCNVPKWQGQAEPVLVDNRPQVISNYTAYQITSIMEGVVQRGTAASAIKPVLPNVPIAGKTGTTNEEKDAWFVGYTPDLLVGVTVGYDTPEPMGGGSTGGHLAAPIFAHFMKMALANKRAVPFRVPPGIKLIPVNRVTGERAREGDADTILEAFKPNEEPTESKSIFGPTSDQ